MQDLKTQSERLTLTLVGLAAALAFGVLVGTFGLLRGSEATSRSESLRVARLIIESELGRRPFGETESDAKLEKRLKAFFLRRGDVLVSREEIKSLKSKSDIDAFTGDVSGSSAFGYFSAPGDDGLHLVKINWRRTFVYANATLAFGLAGGLILGLFAFLGVMLRLHKQRVYRPAVELIRTLGRQAELSQVVQTLAHDVRKPFSTVRAVLRAMAEPSGEPTDATKLRTLARNMLPELELLMVDVDQMIADVLVFERAVATQTEAVAIADLVEKALSEAARHHQADQVSLTYKILIDEKLEVDRQGIVRVLANLLGNAVEAMSGQGHIWIHVTPLRHGNKTMAAVTVGNDGSFIPPDVLARLFRPYSTRGKKTGTGLGLASARRMVEAHGGTLSATSDANSGTEFTLTLPFAKGQLSRSNMNLPTRWSVLAKSLAPVGIDESTKQSMKHLRSQREQLGRPIIVSAADDEAVIWLDAHLVADLDFSVVAQVSRNQARADVIISSDPSQVIEGRERHGRTTCVLLAKDPVAADQAERLERLGVLILQGAVSRLQLIGLLSGAIADSLDAAPLAPKKKIAVVDDDLFILELWQQNKTVQVVTFGSPEQFLSAIGDDASLLESFEAVIVDFHYGMNSTIDGSKLAREIKALADVPVILSTDMPETMTVDREVVDLRCSKGEFSWETLAVELAKALSNRANRPRRNIA